MACNGLAIQVIPAVSSSALYVNDPKSDQIAKKRAEISFFRASRT